MADELEPERRWGMAVCDGVVEMVAGTGGRVDSWVAAIFAIMRSAVKGFMASL